MGVQGNNNIRIIRRGMDSAGGIVVTQPIPVKAKQKKAPIDRFPFFELNALPGSVMQNYLQGYETTFLSTPHSDFSQLFVEKLGHFLDQNKQSGTPLDPDADRWAHFTSQNGIYELKIISLQGGNFYQATIERRDQRCYNGLKLIAEASARQVPDGKFRYVNTDFAQEFSKKPSKSQLLGADVLRAFVGYVLTNF